MNRTTTMASNDLPRVLVISQLPPPVHGSTIMTKVFLETLVRLGYTTNLVDRRFSLNMRQVGKPSLKKIWCAFGLLARLIGSVRRSRPDVCVFFVTTRPGSLVIDWILSETLAALRVPTIAYLHTVGFGPLAARSLLWNFIIRRLLRNCEKIVTLSPNLYSDPAAFVESNEFSFVANTVYDETYRSEQRTPPSRGHVVFMSNLLPEKGARDFIVMAKKLMPLTDAQFSLIGASTDENFVEELRILIRQSGLAERLSMPGPLYGVEKWNILSEATALVFPSTYRFEAQPLTIIEALLTGTPILAYRAGAIADCIVAGETGWMSEPGDIETLVERLVELLNDGQKWSALSDNCRALYAQRFSRDAYERRWHEILKSY